MKIVPIDESFEAVITQMREGNAFGASDAELHDGNMIPRLCRFAGETACAETCQLKLNMIESAGKLCAEENILSTLGKLNVRTENFAMVAATEDRVGFGDDLAALGSSEHSNGFAMVPKCNAFFFRPNKDKGFDGENNLTHVAMRMADCGDVIYTFKDQEGEDVVGISHFSRTNMRGPSAYMHELDGKKVSWGEYVLGNAVEHYGVDPQTIDIKLVAAIEGKDFVHNFTNKEKMEKYFPGWSELGFMHPASDENFDCLIDYREMIGWQLTDSIQNPALMLNPNQINTSEVINTGDLSLGHASHHAAQHGETEHGRDMYLVGLRSQPEAA